MPSVLPDEFTDLEAYADWALMTEAERYAKRLATPLSELQSFYDTAFARIDDVLNYLDRFPLQELPDDAKRLMYLYCSLINVSFPVEVWRQPRVPDSGAASMDCVVELKP